MTTSEQIGELAAALAKAQAEMEGAAKNSTNPHFRNAYPDLASVRDACVGPLSKNGIAVVQSPSISLTAEFGAGVTVETRLIHGSGQWMAGTLSCQMKDASPQSVGSAITYLRRYALLSFAGIAPTDDDGEAAHGRPKVAQPVAKASAPSGYDEWLKKLEGVADGGSDKLKAAWQSSAPDYRKHLTETDNGRWEALKAQSAMADVKLKLVAK
jgi:hypothetical protein